MNRLSALPGRSKALYLLLPLVLLLFLFVLAPAAQAEETNAASNGYYYTVVRGDTLSEIAVRYGSTVYAISAANNIVNPNLIYAGSTLWIPTSYQPHPPAAVCRHYHTVTWGDTLTKLGSWYGVSPWSIAQVNGIQNMNLIYRGQTLCIP